MPVLVCDRPPSTVDAIVAKVQDQALPFWPGWTIRTSPGGIRSEAKQRFTNRAPDLSIARARLQGLVSLGTAELERYSHLKVGWDGYSGELISPIAITTAEYLTAAMAGMKGAHQLTDIIPGPAPDGSLDIEFRTEKRRLIVTIYPGSAPTDLEIRTFRTDGVTSEEKNGGADALVADIRWLLA